MALVDVRGFNLIPKARGLGQGLKTLEAIEALGQRNLQQERTDEVRQILSGLGGTQQDRMLAEQSVGMGEETTIPSFEELRSQAMKVDPVVATQALKQMGLDDPSRRAEASRFAAQAQSLPPEQRQQLIQERAQKLQAEGRDAKDTLQLLNMTPEQQNQALTGVQLLDLSTKERIGFAQKQAKAKSELIKGAEVKSSKILDDGTIIQSMKDGSTNVVSAKGKQLAGEARVKAIKEAQEFGVDIQQRRAKGRGVGKGTAKIALESFDRVGKIRENVTDLQRGIDLIEQEGATTGFIADFLPNMKASTRKFANLRRKLGLNVVGAVTFGALSKGELDLAMDVALPKGMGPEATVKWIKERMVAQQKLADNLEDAALFLSDSENSVADLIRRNRGMAKAAKKKEESQDQTQQATPTGRTATNPKTGDKIQEMSDGTWRAI
jgi:hypothetical protein